jgi:F-type H+-transporting ATPase subunit b
LEFDPASLLVIVAIFATMYLVLRRFLFAPVLRLLEERAGEIEGAESLYQQARAETEAELEAQRGRLVELRAQATQRRDEARRQALERRQVLLQEARGEGEAHLASALAELEQRVSVEKGKLTTLARGLADEMTRRLLGRAS